MEIIQRNIKNKIAPKLNNNNNINLNIYTRKAREDKKKYNKSIRIKY